MPKTTRTLLAVSALAILALNGFSSPESAESSSSASPSSSAPTAFATDLAGPVEEAVAGFEVVLGVEQTSDTSVEVHTGIVDPRGGEGSAEAVEDLEVCEAAAGVDGVENLIVKEADGTGFALYRVEVRILGPSGECFEERG